MTISYSVPADLLVGTDMPLPADPTPAKYITDATNEIDSKIGARYATPLDLPTLLATASTRSTALLIARICNWLASGRLLMAQTSGSELTAVHAYGMSLVKDATAVLDRIASGDIILNGVSTNDTADAGRSGPMIGNVDAASNVESFYDLVTTPVTLVPPPVINPIFPAGKYTY